MREIQYELGDWPTVSGAQAPSVILDPEHLRVYTWGHVGAGTPQPVFDGRHLVLGTIPITADVESLRAVLEGAEATIREIAARKLAGESGDDEWPFLLAGVRYRVDASDWFAADPRSVVDGALDHATITAAAAAEVEVTAPEVILDPEDAADAIRDLLARELERYAPHALTNGIDEDDVDRIAKILRLLGETTLGDVAEDAETWMTAPEDRHMNDRVQYGGGEDGLYRRERWVSPRSGITVYRRMAWEDAPEDFEPWNAHQVERLDDECFEIVGVEVRA